MTGTQIVGLAVRLFSIWLFVYLLRNVPGMWHFNTIESDASANVAVAVTAVILLGIVVVLWLFPLTVASKLLPRDQSERKLAPPPEEVQSVGFCLLGLWIIATAVPSALYWILMSYHAAKPNAVLLLQPQDFGSMLSIGVQIMLGIWLLFGAKGLRGILRWARSSGS